LSSIRPNRHTARATTHVTTNNPTMTNPSTLMFSPDTQSQNAPCRRNSVASNPNISTVPMIKATAIDNPVMVML
jgi:hypothetical protein